MHYVLFFVCIVTIGSFGQTIAKSPHDAALSDSSDIFVQQIIQSKKPVLIDFWAAWCQPCLILHPIIEKIKKEYKGKIIVIKINIDRNRGLARHFKVVSIPSVFLIKDKIAVKKIMGVQPKEVYNSAIDEILNPENKNE